MAEEQRNANEQSTLTKAAKAIGSAAGKVAKAVGAGTAEAEPEGKSRMKPHTYNAEYMGSGTFLISKPRRKSHKRRQSALKGPRPGMRK